MSLKHTPPKTYGANANKTLATQDSDSASEKIYSENDMEKFQHGTRRHKRKHGDLANMEMKELLNNIMRQQSENFAKLEAEMVAIKNQNTETQKFMEFFSEKYDELLEKCNKLQSENEHYKKQTKALEMKVEIIERNTRSTSIELRNIPRNQQENRKSLCATIKELGNVLGHTIQDSDLRNVYRQKTKSQEKNSPIVAEFSTTILKENILISAKKFNKENKDQKLNSKHISLEGPPKPIYVSEFLTPKARHLHYLAREFVKTHKYASCWTLYGKVYMREKDLGPSIRIDCEEDLNKIA